MREDLETIHADGTLIASRVRVARRFGERLRGLLGRPALDRGCGLLLDPGGSVHTFGMRFPIDVVFLDRRRVVLETRSRVGPNRACVAPRRTRATLELWAGACASRRLVPGQRLTFARAKHAPAR